MSAMGSSVWFSPTLDIHMPLVPFGPTPGKVTPQHYASPPGRRQPKLSSCLGLPQPFLFPFPLFLIATERLDGDDSGRHNLPSGISPLFDESFLLIFGCVVFIVGVSE